MNLQGGELSAFALAELMHGPGAGAAVTAAGMMSDMLALGALLTRRG